MKTLNTFGIDKEESVIPTDTKHPSEINESNYNEAFAKSIHLGYDGGLYVTEKDYLKYVKGNELHFGINLHFYQKIIFS